MKAIESEAILIVAALVCVILGVVVGASGAYKDRTLDENTMCRGTPIIKKTEDSVRTFTCTVELKEKN